MINTLLRNADVVRIARLAQLVDTIAPIMTAPGGRAWVQTIYYPFFYAARFGRGVSLRAQTDSPAHDCAAGCGIPTVDCAAALSPDGAELTVFLVNRGLAQPQPCRIAFAQAGAFDAPVFPTPACINFSNFAGGGSPSIAEARTKSAARY